MSNKKHKYSCNKLKAKSRGIDFLLTFNEWMKVWQDSGHWQEREKYCMYRFNNIGAYEIGNVLIMTGKQNIQDKKCCSR